MLHFKPKNKMHTHMRKFVVALFVAETVKQFKYPLTVGQLNKLSYIYTMKYRELQN